MIPQPMTEPREVQRPRARWMRDVEMYNQVMARLRQGERLDPACTEVGRLYDNKPMLSVRGAYYRVKQHIERERMG